MKSIPLALTLAFTLGGFSARAAEVVNTQGWCTGETGKITIVSQMSPSDTAAWADRMNQFVSAMKGRLPGDSRLLGPLTMVLFSSRSDFYDSSPLLKGGDRIQNLSSFSYTGGWGAMEAVCDAESPELTQRAVLRDCADWLLSGYHHHLPRALRAGIDEVYGAFAVEGGREVFGRPPRNWTSYLQRAAGHPLSSYGRFLKIEDLLAVGDMDPVADRHGIQMFFIESWGLAHFLMVSKDMANEHAMDRLLKAFARKAIPHEALRMAFGDEADTINSEFYNYIRGGDFYEVALPVEPPPALAPPAPAAPALVASVLARLEVCAGHKDIARAYAEQAVNLAPGDPSSHDAMALVDFESARPEAADADCRLAIQLGTRNGWTWEIASEEAANRGAQGSPGPTQAREAINDAERAIICSRGLEIAYQRIAALVDTADHVTESDGKFLALGATLLPDNGWIEIGWARWARRVKGNDQALRIIDDVISRAGAVPDAAIRLARDLHREWSAGSG